MLALPPLRSTKDAREGEMEVFSIGDDDFPDFSGINFLDSIDFHDLFVGLHDGDVQSCMEIEPELLPDFSVSGSGDESPEINMAITSDNQVILSEHSRDDDDQNYKNNKNNSHKLEKDEVLSAMETNLSKGEEIEIDSKRLEEMKSIAATSSLKEGDKRRKWSSQQAKNSRGKRKTKVDWTPELHKRFVKAVEKLGVDKAVPSRILELMGIDCLTRHNIASHLQKYRSHRKHSMDREAEAVACSGRRQQIYDIAAGGGKPNMQAWHATPTMGFPPPMAPPIHHLPFRPLHVWGHPTIGRLMMAKWPQRLVPPSSNPPPQAWAAVPPHQPPAVPSILHSHHQRVLNALTPATPCFAQPLPATRFAMPPVAGVPQHAMYKPDHGVSGGGPVAPPSPLPPLDLHPTKESIDAAIGDVLAKPWLPLPIGLKPPAGDSVLVELRRQGLPKVPPATSTSA